MCHLQSLSALPQFHILAEFTTKTEEASIQSPQPPGGTQLERAHLVRRSSLFSNAHSNEQFCKLPFPSELLSINHIASLCIWKLRISNPEWSPFL